jgi:PKD repeat protein
MNIPEIYLVEPYNAYAPKGKKKHWMQEVEEQALLAKIIAEQQALREAAQQRTSNTLPPQAPPTAQAGAQGYSGGAGAAGGPNTTGGGGGAPRPQFFNPAGTYTFTLTPATSSAPTAVQFVVSGPSDVLALGGVQVAWDFGDGTAGGAPATSHVYNGTGSFDVTMTVTSTQTGTILGTQTSEVTMSVPTVTAAFTVTGTTIQLTNGYYTASVNDSLTFVNGSSTNNPSNTLTYAWDFGSGSATSTDTNPVQGFTTTGSFLVQLVTTGLFDATATGTRRIKITGSLP